MKSKKRIKQTGEVFTPDWLVREVINKSPLELWTDAAKTMIDPACGSGNFLVEIYKKKVANGSSPLQALQTLYGVDIMPDNIQECRKRLLHLSRDKTKLFLDSEAIKAVRNNIRLGDALKFSMEDVFAPLNFASRELRGFRFEQQGRKEVTPKKESTESA